MIINVDPIKLTGKAVSNALSGVRYAFAYNDIEDSQEFSDFREKSLSVLFTKEYLQVFLSDSTVSSFIDTLEKSRKKRIDDYRNDLKKGKKALMWHDKKTGEDVDFYSIYEERMKYLLDKRVNFYEIRFVD
jgi:hypothetical protein